MVGLTCLNCCTLKTGSHRGPQTILNSHFVYCRSVNLETLGFQQHVMQDVLGLGILSKIKIYFFISSPAYLWQSSVKLSLQRVSFMANFMQFALGQAQILLSLSQSVQKTISFLQHGHHQ